MALFSWHPVPFRGARRLCNRTPKSAPRRGFVTCGTVALLALVLSVAAPRSARAQGGFDLPKSPQAAMVPGAGETWFRGNIESIDVKSNTIELVVDAKLSDAEVAADAAATPVTLKPIPVKITVAGAASIYPLGAPAWKLPLDALAAGDSLAVVGKTGAGDTRSATARLIECARREAKLPVDYFVSQDGDDANDGSPGAPWRTIQNAIEKMPNGTEAISRVLHIGPGNFSESPDGTIGQLRLQNKSFLILTGAGAHREGTQITTDAYQKKNHSGVLRLQNCNAIDVLNLTIGDERPWDDEVFFESTVHLEGNSNATFESVQIVGPSREVLAGRGARRAQTAMRCVGDADEATLRNCLVSGHGTFISNSRGKVFSRNVTFADMGGFDPDDQFLFMQLPDGEPRNDPRFTFDDCLFYQLQGGIRNKQAMLSFGGPFGGSGESKVYFNSPETVGGGNKLVRARLDTKGGFVQTSDLPRSFNLLDQHYTLAHGIYAQNDVLGALIGGVTVDNSIELDERDGFALVAPATLKSGWRGGMTTPVSSPLDAAK